MYAFPSRTPWAASKAHLKSLRILLGYTNKELADQLRISVKTVETYKVRLGEKLGLRSRAETVRYALRHGWLSEGASLTPLNP